MALGANTVPPADGAWLRDGGDDWIDTRYLSLGGIDR
jgi:hypothetical protein